MGQTPSLAATESGLPIPSSLELPPNEYFRPQAHARLLTWSEEAKQAMAVRQAAIREAVAKAKYNNLLNLCKLKKEVHGVLDRHTIQAALGKCLPRQRKRMWGISGPVTLGACFPINPTDCTPAIATLRSWPGADESSC